MPPLLGGDLLAIYLNDHLAGAAGGLELVRRAQRANQGTALGDELAELAAEIEEDRAALVAIMERLDVGGDRLKVAAGWAAEKVGRLKLNGRLLGYSPLSRVVELEALLLGVNAKRAGWRALRDLAITEPRLDVAELDRLIDRAERQIERLEEQHRRAAAEALAER
jgi:hypothetical protein